MTKKSGRPGFREFSFLGLLVLAGALMVFGQRGRSMPSGGSPDAMLVPSPTLWPLDERLDSPGYGLDIHMWWDPWAAVRRDWPLVQQAGFTWVKQRLAWQDVEGAGPGRYEWAASDRIVERAEAAGIHLIFRVDAPPAWATVTPKGGAREAVGVPVSLQAFGHFCATLAARYQGRVDGYQIWNEPNLAREWGGKVPDAAGYVAMLRTCYVAIKEADPHALVISAALAPTGSSLPEAVPDVDYLVQMYQAGAASYFDLLGLNAPGYKAPPELSPEEAGDPSLGYGGHSFFCFRHVEEMREIMVQYGDARKQVAILEFGWHTDKNPAHPDYVWFAVTPEQQAAYLVRAFEYAREHWRPWIGPMFVWNFPDPRWTPDNEEFWWSIVDPFWYGMEGEWEAWPGGGVRPAYEALKQMPKQ